MKSSSELFPVMLQKADVVGDLSEDLYLVKHNRDTDRSVQIAVYHLGLPTPTAQHRPPVVLVHGSFSNRGFWLSNKGEGLARHLLDEGFDVWLMETRGHGHSPRNQDYLRNDVERYARFDLAAVNEFIMEKTAQRPFWIGHSLGGVTIAAALASGVFSRRNCAGMVLLGTQAVRKPLLMWLPFAGWLTRAYVRAKGELSGVKLGIGPENEPHGVINEWLRRCSPFGRWTFRSTKQHLMRTWKNPHATPLLAVVAQGDKSDPASACIKFAKQYGGDKDILMLGKQHGFCRNYGHVDMIVSKDAAQEVWPRISQWLHKQQST